MWSLPQRLPWQPLSESYRPDFVALRYLEAAGEQVVALTGGTPGTGRYSAVGIAHDARPIESAEHARYLFDTPRADALRVVALSYELGRGFTHLRPKAPPSNQPLGLVSDLQGMLVVDHERNAWTVLGARHEAHHLALLASSPQRAPRRPRGAVELRALRPDAAHEANIRLAQAYISLGHIYQGNVCRTLAADGLKSGVEAHIALSQHNPVAHGCFLRAQGIEIVANTMETLCTYDPETRRVASFPIKGTRRRRAETNLQAAEELRSDPKECAEHTMIVDLVRNDLGKVCTPGSVRVPSLMRVEGYRGVWHGVSTVEGKLRDDASLGDVVASLFPGGSITGAPKRRAIEVLDSIEGQPRGFYTGSVGLLAPNGRLSMSILIRTLVRDERGWTLGVGGGIVADSVPSREIEETYNKVRVFQEVLGGGRLTPTQASVSTAPNAANLEGSPRDARSSSTGSGLTTS